MSLLISISLMLYLCRESLGTALCDNSLPVAARIQALESLAKIVSIEDDVYVRKYYTWLITNKHQDESIITRTYSCEKCIPKYAIIMFAERYRSRDLRQCMEMLYKIRAIWWHDDSVKNKLLSIIKAKYPKFDGSAASDLNDVNIIEYCSYLMCNAYVGNQNIKPVMLVLLRDKRVATDFLRYSAVGHSVPLPSRICDFAMISLLILHQVDIPTFSRDYGYPLNFTDKKFANPQRYIENAFDAMIADYDVISRKYFK